MIRKSITLLALTAAGSLAPLWSQSPGSSFQNFRNELLARHEEFRSEILSNYASFLDGVWKEYDSFRGVERSSVPKPEVQPLFTPSPSPSPEPEATALPEPVAVIPDAVPEPPVPPAPDPVPPAPVQPVAPATVSIDYHGLNLDMPVPGFKLGTALRDERAYASAWRSLAAEPAVKDAILALRRKAGEMGMNDYLTYDLVSHWVDGAFPRADETARMSLVHYMLANMGYDIRLARTQSGDPLLLIPFNQKVYARRYMNIDGKRYYIFAGKSDPNLDGVGIYTCSIPSQMDAGRPLDLRITPLNIPYKAHTFDVSFGGISISGEVNENLFPILYKYPQMPTADFAQSVVSPEVRKSIVDQIGKQVDGADPRAAADKILKFVQSGFEYATDGDFHGFEKPYFFEEVLYYDKCDCEDRAVFYTYLLWNVLGLESQLLCYPGHESASVRLDDGKPGDSYTYKGKKFYISDPTYIGASTGMCMPVFVSVTPEIDYTYTR